MLLSMQQCSTMLSKLSPYQLGPMERSPELGGDSATDVLGNFQLQEWLERGRTKTENGGVSWDGNRLAYPHRAGFRPVSDQCQSSPLPDCHSPCHSPSSPPYTVQMSSCPVRCTVMSDAQKSPVGLPQCPFRTCTSLDRIIQENST